MRPSRYIVSNWNEQEALPLPLLGFPYVQDRAGGSAIVAGLSGDPYVYVRMYVMLSYDVMICAWLILSVSSINEYPLTVA